MSLYLTYSLSKISNYLREISKGRGVAIYCKKKLESKIVNWLSWTKYLNECNYYDERSFLDKFANNKNPLFLSFNIQSLQSKFYVLSTFANILQNRQVLVDIIGP